QSAESSLERVQRRKFGSRSASVSLGFSFSPDEVILPLLACRFPKLNNGIKILLHTRNGYSPAISQFTNQFTQCAFRRFDSGNVYETPYSRIPFTRLRLNQAENLASPENLNLRT